MRRAVYAGAGRIDLDDAEAREPGPGEVRIAVAFNGICGTDLHVLRGDMGTRVKPPAVLGHEMSGVVDAVGEGVEGRRLGDAVTVMPLRWDGTCPACRAGHEHVCQHLDFVGIDSPGALQEHWTVPADLLVGLPSSMPLEHGALVEPVAVAVHDVRRSEASAGDAVVVVGAGPIGSLIALVAGQRGADVLVLETDPGRRASATRLGLRVADPAVIDVLALVAGWTADAGADVVFEVSGSAAGLRGAPHLLKVRGTLVVVAIHPEPRPFDFHRVFWRELRVLGARVYEREDFDEAVRLLAAGGLPVNGLITGILPVERTAEAFERLAAGQDLKVLIRVGTPA